MKVPFGPYCIALGDLKPDPVTWVREVDPLFLVTLEINENLKAVKNASPSKKLVVMGRHYSPKWGLAKRSGARLPSAENEQHEKMRLRAIADPKQTALELFNDMRDSVERGRGVVDFWMGANEFTCTNVTEAQALCQFNIEWARLEHSIGIEVAAYAMPEGNPGDLKLWSYLLPAVYECNKKMTVHEYTAPDFESGFPWHIGRFSLMLNEFPADLRDTVEIYIGENGFDGGISGFDKPLMGWKGHYGNNFGGYRDKVLLPYAKFVSQFPQIRGVAQFAAHWGSAPSFDIGDQVGYEDFIREGLPEMIEPNKFASDVQRAQAVLDQDFVHPDWGLAVSFAENRDGNLMAVNINSAPGKPYDKSRDRGPWSINDWFYLRKPGITFFVSDECAFDLECSTAAAFKISNGGTDFTLWSVWDSEINNFRDQLPRARAAIALATDRVLLAGKNAIANHPLVKLPMPVFDGGWLYKQAMVWGIGCPETPEIPFTALNKPRLILECARGYAIMIADQNETTRIVLK